MSKHTKRSMRNRPAAPRRRRQTVVVAAILLAGALAAAALFLGIRGSGVDDPPRPVAAQRSPAVPVTPASGLEALKGRWLRPDGGYVLEILAVDDTGAVDATYLNPRPINVARAEATLVGSTPKVLVELRAPGYPGSTYTLTYDVQRDKLAGVYFQAALQQSFDVVFDRLK